MSARYLIRLDDACSTMNAERWQRIEAILEEAGVRPIVAVVPDNQDPFLKVDPEDAAFWETVRAWQRKNWTIAMHGYQHTFHSINRRRLVLPFYDRSEFAGLPEAEQAQKIRASWELFSAQGVYPSAWIAPAHCFDWTTLRAIERETPIRLVSDGIAWDQYFDRGFYWLPQQLWSYVPRDSGLWTICLHPNGMSMEDLEQFRGRLAQLAARGQVVSVSDLELRRRGKSIRDHLYSAYFWQRSRLYAVLARLRARESSA